MSLVIVKIICRCPGCLLYPETYIHWSTSDKACKIMNIREMLEIYTQVNNYKTCAVKIRKQYIKTVQQQWKWNLSVQGPSAQPRSTGYQSKITFMQSCRNRVFSYISKHNYYNKISVTAQWVSNNKVTFKRLTLCIIETCYL